MAFKIEKLQRNHDVEGFDCGREELNRFLVRFAFPSQQAGSSQTYVGLSNGGIIGYYTIVFGCVGYEAAPERLIKGLARHPVPLMILARLAVRSDWQKRGAGSSLLKDALRRTVQASEIAGLRAIAVHAKDKSARSFYSRFGFIPSPSDPYHLFLLMKDLRRIVK